MPILWSQKISVLGRRETRGKKAAALPRTRIQEKRPREAMSERQERSGQTKTQIFSKWKKNASSWIAAKMSDFLRNAERPDDRMQMIAYDGMRSSIYRSINGYEKRAR